MFFLDGGDWDDWDDWKPKPHNPHPPPPTPTPPPKGDGDKVSVKVHIKIQTTVERYLQDCIKPKGSNCCFQYDKTFLAANVDEAVLNFVDQVTGKQWVSNSSENAVIQYSTYSTVQYI